MRFSENRLVAWIVFAACVIFSLSFSGGSALRNQRSDVQQIFFYGAMNDGLCIDKDLTVRSESAYNLSSTAAKYPEIDAALVTAAKEASNALAAATTVADKYVHNSACQRAVEDLYTAIDNTSMTETDMAYCYKLYKEFQSRADTISRDPYNQKAEEFNASLEQFPAGLVGGLFGVRALELFDS